MVEIAGEIGNPARGEDERRRLAVQVGELGLELHDRMMRAGNVARAAGAGAVRARRPDRGLDHVRMAAHAEIVVRAPDGDLARPALLARRAPHRHREAGGVALEIGEDAISLFRLQAGDRILEAPFVVHARSFPAPAETLLSDPAFATPPPARLSSARPFRRRGRLSQVHFSRPQEK